MKSNVCATAVPRNKTRLAALRSIIAGCRIAAARKCMARMTAMARRHADITNGAAMTHVTIVGIAAARITVLGIMPRRIIEAIRAIIMHAPACITGIMGIMVLDRAPACIVLIRGGQMLTARGIDVPKVVLRHGQKCAVLRATVVLNHVMAIAAPRLVAKEIVLHRALNSVAPKEIAARNLAPKLADPRVIALDRVRKPVAPKAGRMPRGQKPAVMAIALVHDLKSVVPKAIVVQNRLDHVMANAAARRNAGMAIVGVPKGVAPLMRLLAT